MTTFEPTRTHITHKSPGLFSPAEIVVSRAPGRIDLMGGIADYSGSLVLQWPIAAATHVALQLQDTPTLQIRSLPSISDEQTRSFEMPLADLYAHDYASARALFQRESDQYWAAYVAGAFLVLMRERNCVFEQGARILITSDVPEGKGVSSSAALEVATMQGLVDAFDIRLEPREMALLCQKVENLVAGAPCGVMDQMTCVFGDEHALLALLCQPAELQPPVPIPEDIELWGLDSGERHAVGGSDYGVVRAGAFMGLRILSEHMSVPPGYLANISPDEFEKSLVRQLPAEMSGDEFLDRYGRTADTVTTVERGCRYQVRAPTAHPVHERRRAETFRSLLLDSGVDARRQLGELMYESHASYGRCGLGSTGTDRLVALVRAQGPDAGLYGARITGGGSGGTVAVVGRRGASHAIARIVDAYEQQTRYRPYVFAGSSPGVMAFGARTITL